MSLKNLKFATKTSKILRLMKVLSFKTGQFWTFEISQFLI